MIFLNLFAVAAADSITSSQDLYECPAFDSVYLQIRDSFRAVACFIFFMYVSNLA